MAMINRSVALIAGVPLGLQDPSSGGSSDFLVPRHISLPPLSPIMIELNPSEERLPINVEQQERHRQEEDEDNQTAVVSGPDLPPLQGEEPGTRDTAHGAQ